MTPETEQEPVDFPTEYVKDMAIHTATQAIYDLFETVSIETAHWISTVAIINAERAARSRSYGDR